MDNTKTEMLKKLIEMKKELSRKQKKLEKFKRVARAKAHIREKIKENVNLLTDSHTDELLGTRCPSNGRSPNSSVRLSSVSHTEDSQAKHALINVIKQSTQLRPSIDIHDHKESSACDGIKETYPEHDPVTESDSTAVVCTGDSYTQRAVTLLTGKNSHDAVDDAEDYHKSQHYCEKSVVDFCADRPVIPYSETTLHLSEEVQPVKPVESFEADKGFELGVVLTQLSHMSTESTTAEYNLQTSHKQSVVIDCVSSADSEATVVKGTPVNITSLNPHYCHRKKHTSSGSDYLEITSPSTSSFEHLMDQFNSKNIPQTLSQKDSSVIRQETITDSEFFSALGLTQKDGVVLSQEITEHQTPNTAEREVTLSQICNSHDNMSGKSHQSHHLPAADGTSSVNTLVADCAIQQDIAGSRLPVNSLSLTESDMCSHSALVNSTSSFSEYTELDAIPYSQFELTEDFLSETQTSQEWMNRVTHTAKKYGALVKRRSCRLSSYDFTHSRSAHLKTCHLLPYSGSVLSDCACAAPRFKSKQTKPAAQQTKAAAVLSVFQFLIDEAKKVNMWLEFELPSLYDNLISSRLKCATVSDGFVAAHNHAANKENSAAEAEDYEVKSVMSHRFSLKKNIGQPASTACKKDHEVIEEFIINVDKKNIRDAYRADAVMDTCVDEVLPESKLCPDNAQSQEINVTLLNNEHSSSDANVEKNSLGIDSRHDALTEVLTDTGRSSNILRPNQHSVGILNGSTTSVKQKRMPVYKSRGKLFHRTFGKSVAKTLFAAKNTNGCAEPDGLNYNPIGDRVTTVSEVCSTAVMAMPLETTSHQCVQLQESHAQGEDISVKRTSLSDRDVVLAKSDIAVTLCDTSTTKLKTWCPSSQCDSVHLQMTTPKLLRHHNNEHVLNIHTQFADTYHALTTGSSPEVASTESSASFLYSPNTSANHLKLQASSEVSSWTSTPKTVAAHRTGHGSSQLDFDISFVGNGQSTEMTRSLMHGPADRNACHQYKTPVPQAQSPLDLSESACTSPGFQVVFPDESCLSCVDTSVEIPGLHQGDAAVSTDVSSAIQRYNETQNNVSHLFVTSCNLISPWKKLMKTASSPVIVLERHTPGNYQMTPVFSPFIRRSRSKLINSGSRSRNVFTFSGCFQSCAQDAVVTLLNGHAITTDQEMKPYIVSVQATSLTVWTEDALSGWVAELDWKLASEMHIMKACLLPRHDSVIAIAASGWNNQSLFATLFLYDWNTGDTTRCSIPLLEQQCQLQSPSQIELCCVTASELDIAVTSDTHYVIGRMFFDDCVKSVKCVTTSQVQRGKLLSSMVVSGQASANVSLTSDQEITIWNMVLGVAVKKIQVRPPLPCLIRLLTAASHQGILLLDTVWRVDDGDCGGVIAVNPVTGDIQKVVTFTVPNNTWRRIESAQSEASFVTAISDKGSLSIWNRSNGELLGYTKSKTTTCASVTTVAKHLIIGDIRGCLHIYST